MYKELDFIGYPAYRVHTNGTIESSWKRLGRGKGRSISNTWKKLKGYKNKGNYLTFRLCNSYGKKRYSIHVLVALAFIPNPNNLPMVLHNDGNPLNNNVNNLRWGTAKDNALDAMQHGTFSFANNIGMNHKNTKLTNDEVKEIKVMIKNKISGVKIAKKFNTSIYIISNIKLGKTWKHIH